MCVHTVCMCECLHEPEEYIQFPRDGPIGSCKEQSLPYFLWVTLNLIVDLGADTKEALGKGERESVLWMNLSSVLPRDLGEVYLNAL